MEKLTAYLEDNLSHPNISFSEVDLVECIILITVLQPEHETGGGVPVAINAKKLRKVLMCRNPENGGFRPCFLTISFYKCSELTVKCVGFIKRKCHF